MIRNVTQADMPQITAIYNHFIANTTITFETEPVSVDEMTHRMQHISAQYPYLVMEEDGEILGYCYVHSWKEKEAYSKTVESTIYLKPGLERRGLGTLLMNALIDASRHAGLHVLVACITYPNVPSEKLHLNLGFKQVSRFHEVGFKFGKWIDIYDFQLIL